MKQNCLKILLFLLVCLCTTQVKAQRQEFVSGFLLNANGVSFNGKASNFWDGADGTVWGGLGGSYGLSVQYDITKKIYIRPELRYSRKGSIYEFTSQYGTRAFESISMYYLEIPVIFGFRLNHNKREYIFESGLAVSKLFLTRFSSHELFFRYGTPNSETFNTIDALWIGSLKWCVNTRAKKNIFFGVRVSHSITPIYNNFKIFHFDYGVELNYLII